MESGAGSSPREQEQARSRLRGGVVFAIKAVVTVSLITWLVRSDSLDFKRLRVFLESPRVLLVTCGAWLCFTLGLTTWRWKILLEAVGEQVSLLRAAGLQVTALFFNGLVPGNVGGDFIKNQAVLGNQAAKLFVMVLVERTVGLISLVWAGGLGLLLSFRAIQTHPELLPIAGGVLFLLVGSVVGPWLFLKLMNRSEAGGPRAQTAAAGLAGAVRRSLHSAMAAFQLIRSARGAVLKGVLVSLGMHLGNIGYFLFLTRELGNPGALFSEVAMVFPLGMMTLVLPISISGFGVGHVMFNELFRLLGLVGGATIFNVFIVAQLTPCLLGAVTYLFMRGDVKARAADEPSEKPSETTVV